MHHKPVLKTAARTDVDEPWILWRACTQAGAPIANTRSYTYTQLLYHSLILSFSLLLGYSLYTANCRMYECKEG